MALHVTVDAYSAESIPSLQNLSWPCRSAAWSYHPYVHMPNIVTASRNLHATFSRYFGPTISVTRCCTHANPLLARSSSSTSSAVKWIIETLKLHHSNYMLVVWSVPMLTELGESTILVFCTCTVRVLLQPYFKFVSRRSPKFVRLWSVLASQPNSMSSLKFHRAPFHGKTPYIR